MGEQEFIRAEHINKTFSKQGKKIKAVDDVSLELYRGECFGLIGESGSGKSTLANVIAGLEKADSGAVYMDGPGGKINLLDAGNRKIQKEYCQRRQMIFQNPRLSFNPAMTIGKGLEEGVRYYTKIPAARRKELALENLELVGLKREYYDRHSSELSGGECQRAAIARALMIEPEFLICDEITSALDVSVQAQIMSLFMEIQKKKKMTCLFISHDLALVSSICNRIAVMYNGKIVESGDTKQIIYHSSSNYTQKLLQSVFFADRETMTRYERKKMESSI